MIADHYVILGARSREELERFWRRFLARNGGREPHASTGRAIGAYVNHGRWVADCPCGSGVVCCPADKDACCLECGTVHRIAFPTPAKRARGEAALERRPGRNRNWYPATETVASLERENADRMGVI